MTGGNSSDIADVYFALRRYVLVHDAVFSFSWRKLLPIPGIFLPVDYAEHAAELSGVAATLSRVRKDIAGNLSIPAFFSEYVTALLLTIETLHHICECLDKEAKGAAGIYKFGSYRRDVDHYRELAKNYQLLGDRVNEYLLASEGKNKAFERP
ncbi:MAG TPA: hypothetical protein VF275_11730 [Gammaproteobacteria bacterium]